jgi:L-threonylcarbamoyladenylate synthase
MVLNAGPCAVGLESTIVALSGNRPKLLRPGGLPAELIETTLGTPLERTAIGDRIIAPGMLTNHYAPHLPLRVNASSAAASEALLAFGRARIEGAERAIATRNLSPSEDLVEAAANLFAHLAELDRSGASAIAVAPIPHRGLGEAINDRLTRAAIAGPVPE